MYHAGTEMMSHVATGKYVRDVMQVSAVVAAAKAVNHVVGKEVIGTYDAAYIGLEGTSDMVRTYSDYS